MLEGSPVTRRTLRMALGMGIALAMLASAPGASAATCSGTAGSAYSTAITGTAGLVSYWRLGEPSGTAACDSFGSNGGTYQGGFALGRVGAIAGDPDTAAGFDGSTGNVSIPHTSSGDVGDNFTVEAWVKRNSFGAP